MALTNRDEWHSTLDWTFGIRHCPHRLMVRTEYFIAISCMFVCVYSACHCCRCLPRLLLLPCGILIASHSPKEMKRISPKSRASHVWCAPLAMSSPRRQKHERITHRITLLFKYSNASDNNNTTNRDRKYFMHFLFVLFALTRINLPFATHNKHIAKLFINKCSTTDHRLWEFCFCFFFFFDARLCWN